MNELPEIEVANFVDTVRMKFSAQKLSNLLTRQDFIAALGDGTWDSLWSADDVETLDKPERQPFGVSPRGAELYVAQWLKWMGFESIQVTPARRDGGYDISADNFLVQVKNWNKDWVPVSSVREIFGVAQLAGKRAMVFSRGFLSEDAAKFASDANIPVFLFNAEEAILTMGNDAAKSLLESQIAHKGSKLFCVHVIAMNHAEMTQIQAFLNATYSLSDYFDPTFSEELRTLLANIHAISHDSLAGDMEEQVRDLMGLDVANLTLRILDALKRSENIRAVHGMVAELVDDNHAEISVGLSRVYESEIGRG